ncbi:ATP-grasp domain-containing protein [Hydrogenimonas sp.]
MSKVLILGAGVYQTPLIRKAKELGHETIVISIPGNYPGFRYADKIYYKDTRDYKAILEIAQKEKINGITTLGTDVAVRSIGYVCENMNLVGINEATGIATTNKKFMKEKFGEYGVRTPSYLIVRSLEEAYNAYDELIKPVVFKVVDRSGSKGVFKLEKESDVEKAYHYCVDNTDMDYIIAEEFIEGIKFGVEAAVIEKKPAFNLPMGDILYKSKIEIPIGHYSPYPLKNSIHGEIENQLSKIIHAFDLDYCAVNLDLILKDEKIYVLEAAARAGGSNIAELISLVYDIDYYKFIIDLSLGTAKPFNTEEKNGGACQVLLTNKSGTLKEIILEGENNNLTELVMDYNIGEKVKKFETGPDRIGHIVIKCGSEEHPLSILEETLSNIKIVIE